MQPVLVDTIERIRLTAHMEQADWCDLLNVHWSDYQKFKAGQIQLESNSFESLAHHFSLPLEKITSGDLNFTELALQAETKNAAFPEKYLKAAFGRRRSSINSVQFLEDTVNWRLRLDVVKKFELPESELQDPFKSISVQFMIDLCAYLQRRGFKSENFMAMGAYNYETSKNTLIGQFFSSLRSASEIYEYMITEGMKMFEANCTYTLKKLSPTGGIFEVHSNSDVAHEMRVKHIGSRQLCEFKAGHAASMPLYLGLPMALVQETACVHRGDSCCRFEFSYPFTA